MPKDNINTKDSITTTDNNTVENNDKKVIDITSVESFRITAGSGPEQSLDYSELKQTDFIFSQGQKLQVDVDFISAFHTSTSGHSVKLIFVDSQQHTVELVLNEKEMGEVIFENAGVYSLSIQNDENISLGYSFILQESKIASPKYDINVAENHSNNSNQNTITNIPINIETIENGVFIWLGEFALSYGDKMYYDVSAEKGDGLQVGFVSPEDDPLNRTYFTISNKREYETLKTKGNFTFESPAKPGKYNLFIRATDGDLTNVKGSITIEYNQLSLNKVNSSSEYLNQEMDVVIEKVNAVLNNDKPGIEVSFSNTSDKTIQSICVRLKFPDSDGSTGINADFDIKYDTLWSLESNKKRSYFWTFSHNSAGLFKITITSYTTVDGKSHTISENNWKWLEFYYPGKDSIASSDDSRELFTTKQAVMIHENFLQRILMIVSMASSIT